MNFLMCASDFCREHTEWRRKKEIEESACHTWVNLSNTRQAFYDGNVFFISVHTILFMPIENTSNRYSRSLTHRSDYFRFKKQNSCSVAGVVELQGVLFLIFLAVPYVWDTILFSIRDNVKVFLLHKSFFFIARWLYDTEINY